MTNKIACASATLSDLCQETSCSNEVCGTCSYCGRPICQDHGWRSNNRYYCNAHGPKIQASYIASVVQLMSQMAVRRGVPLHEISVGDVRQFIESKEQENR